MKYGGTGLGGIGTFGYGYYEMRARLPGYYNSSNQPSGHGMWPTFWLFYQFPGVGCQQVHDEVDMIDSGPDVYQSADVVASDVGDEDGACEATGISSRPLFRSPRPLFESFHTYGVEFMPNRILFYFDEEPY